MKKCEWKYGKFEPCEAFNGAIGTISFVQNYNGSFVRCEHCKRPITKPEPEVIIKKSGETWGARYEGIDYLCINDHGLWENGKPSFLDRTSAASTFRWKPILEIEITDEIAKLRPMVVFNYPDDRICLKNEILYGVVRDKYITDSFKEYKEFYRLATVEDL